MEEIQSRLNVDTLMQLHLVMEGTQRHTLLVMKWYRNNISQFQSSTMRKDHSCRHVSKERFVKWTLMCGDYSHSLNFWYRTSVSQVTLSCSPVQNIVHVIQPKLLAGKVKPWRWNEAEMDFSLDCLFFLFVWWGLRKFGKIFDREK